MSVQSPPSVRRNHALLIAACVVVALTAVGVILECRGPFRGWLGRLRGTLAGTGEPSSPVAAPGEPTPVAAGAAPVPASPVASAASVPAAAEASVSVSPPPSALHSRYAELYAERLAKLRQPEIGAACRLALLSGEKVRGRLAKLEPGRVTLLLEHGTQSFMVHTISRKDVLKLFPAFVARNQAMAALRREMAARNAPAGPASQAPVAEVPDASLPERQVDPPQEADVSANDLRSYDPTPGPTPERLKPTLAAFGDWLKTQHRRVGGRIADKIYARRQAGRTVLYLRMDPMFMAQDYGTRYQIAEGMQIFWALRCQGNGVAGMARAHVVLLDQRNRIVGGSRLNDPTDIWLQGK